MECQDFQDHLIGLLYNESAHDERHLVVQHVLGCPSCQTQWQKAIMVQTAFKSLPDREPSQTALDNILHLARQHRKSSTITTVVWSWIKNWQLSLNLAPGLVAVFLFISVVTLVLESQFSSQPSSMAGATFNVEPTPSNVESARALSFLTGEQALKNRINENPFSSNGLRFNPSRKDFSFQREHESFLPQVKSVALEARSLDFMDSTEAVEEGASLPLQLQKQNMEQHRLLMETDADALLMRGRRLKSMGRVDLALKDFETIYHFYPDYSYMGDVLMYRAQCYAFQGNVEKAVESLGLYEEKFPSQKVLVESMVQQLRSTSTASP